MPQISPIFASERNAAKLLDMKPAQFRALVDDGTLPRPVKLGHHERWDVKELEAIGRGERINPLDHTAW